MLALVGALFVASAISCVEVLCITGAIEVTIYLAGYAGYWHHALILVILLELLVLKGLLVLGVASACCTIRRLTLFIFIVVMAGAAGLGVALISLMVRACGDDSMRVHL